MTDLVIVPAGAGAGKTHRIKETLTEWVSQGEVRPERILAVTFTEAAASELRQRIRTSLIENGMLDAALAVERAYVSTIHGLGLRLLTEHAFANGSSPIQRLISDDERDLLIRQEVARCEVLKEVSKRLLAFGYKPDFQKGKSAEDGFRDRLFAVISLLRNLGERGRDPGLADLIEAAIRRDYGPVDSNGPALGDALHRLVVEMLGAFPQSLEAQATSKAAKEAFQKDFQTLSQVRQNRRLLDQDWSFWEKLRQLRGSKRGSPTPQGYDEAVANVVSAAEKILTHPGPLADAIEHARALIRGAQDVLTGYAENKRGLGVIDFSDMVTAAAQLLQSNPQVLNAILGEIDCVIVDEFQDTNPIQFTFLWLLARSAKRTLLVGDIKQAIMGFQGADPRLTEALIQQNSDKVDPLEQNWRSDPRIMEFVNALGPQLFGQSYISLAPTRKAGSSSAIELLSVTASRKSRNGAARPQHFAADHIDTLLHDKDCQVPDRHSKIMRPIEPRDIAILCPTNVMCSAYATQLRTLGIPVRVSEAGWWSSPVIQAAVHALSYASDAQDRHAALCFATLGPPHLPLEQALRELADQREIAHPLLGRLKSLWPASLSRPVDQLVHDVIQATALRDWCDIQADPEQARADLLRFEAEARNFIDTHRDMRAASGFHGNDAKVFLGWLQAKVSTGEFDLKPNPAGKMADGVEVVTWHASKGREWPAVIVAGLDHDKTPRAGQLSTIFPDFSDLKHIVDRAEIEFAPPFVSKEVNARFLDKLRPEAELNCRRLLYVALTRARDRLIIEWPEFHVEKKEEENTTPPITAARILKHACGLTMGHNDISIGKASFPARIRPCPKEMPSVFEKTAQDLAKASQVGQAQMAIGRGAIIHRPMPAIETRLVLQPSQTVTTDMPLPASISHTKIADGIIVPTGSFAQATDRGTAVHEALRVLLLRPNFAERVAEHTGLDPATVEGLGQQARALRHFLEGHGYHRLSVEQPVVVTFDDGTTLNAIIDLLAESDEGFAIIDHKSEPVQEHAVRFASYWPQLATYVDVINRQGKGKKVLMVEVNWTSDGTISWSKIEANGG